MSFTLYGDAQSGNCYKIILLASLLDLPYQWQPVDILAGETQKESFTTLNPAGQIPVIELESGEYLAESNAIIQYLANGTTWWPVERLAQAQVLKWMFFEQYSHEPYIAVARFIRHYQGMPAERLEEFKSKQAGGIKALNTMEQQLSQHHFIAGEKPSIADIALFAYTHVAADGGFELAPYTGIRDWIDRITRMPGFIEIGAANPAPSDVV